MLTTPPFEPWAELARDNVSPIRSDLPDITGEDVGRAALHFPRSTAATIDGIHDRHFSVISDEGREAIACLLNAMEDLSLIHISEPTRPY